MQIYIRRNAEERGPFDLLTVRLGLDAKTILPTDWAWYEGAPDWMPVSQLPGIGIEAPVASPPIPPVVPDTAPRTPLADPFAPSFQPTKIGCWPMLAAIIVVFLVGVCGGRVLVAIGAETFANILFASFCFGSIGWVFFDAMALKTGRGQVAGLADMPPWAWAVCFMLVWFIAFPIYLVARPEIIKVNNRYPNGIPASGRISKTPSVLGIAVGCLAMVVVIFIAIAVLTVLGNQLSGVRDENVLPVPRQGF